MVAKKSVKTAWIVDGAYLYLAAPERERADFLALERELEAQINSPLDRGHYFTEDKDEAKAFHSWLQTAPPHGPHMRVYPYQAKYREKPCAECSAPIYTFEQKGVDVGIAILATRLAHQNRYDRLLLIAGDRDFVDAVSYIVNGLHKEVWIVGFADSISTELQEAATDVIWLDDFWQHVRRLPLLARAA